MNIITNQLPDVIKEIIISNINEQFSGELISRYECTYVCEISKTDIANFIEENNLTNIILENEFEEILRLIEKVYDSSGEGLHGTQLIEYVIREKYL